MRSCRGHFEKDGAREQGGLNICVVHLCNQTPSGAAVACYNIRKEQYVVARCTNRQPQSGSVLKHLLGEAGFACSHETLNQYGGDWWVQKHSVMPCPEKILFC
mmetsp:Transcript_62127/g.119742  ORF Transcript_62127/g.119742 Transcript_62127/m.119742 type:complete len:103 (-) Transcript_62127:1021-1329(-)